VSGSASLIHSGSCKGHGELTPSSLIRSAMRKVFQGIVSCGPIFFAIYASV